MANSAKATYGSATPTIAITSGEPAGIGPDILLQAATRDFPAELVAIADPSLLRQRADWLRSIADEIELVIDRLD